MTEKMADRITTTIEFAEDVKDFVLRNRKTTRLERPNDKLFDFDDDEMVFTKTRVRDGNVEFLAIEKVEKEYITNREGEEWY